MVPITLFALVIIGAFVLCLVMWLWWRFSDTTKKIEKIPGPNTVPIFGNSLEIMKPTHELLPVFEKWMNQFGSIYRFWIGFRTLIVLSSPEYIELILNNPKILDKTQSYDLIRPWIGDGLLNSTGRKWRSRRRLLTPTFHFRILDSFFKVYNEQSTILVNILNREASQSEGRVDIYSHITLLTLDVICEATMGIRVNAQEKDSEYVKAIRRVGQIAIERFLRPWLHSYWIFRLTALGRENAKNLDIVHKFINKVIEERKHQLDEYSSQKSAEDQGKKVRNAFLDTLLNAAKEDPTITMDDIRDEVNTFMFEGHDTTSAAISWLLYCMALHPEEQVKVQEEIDPILENSGVYCTIEAANQMKYLECCIKEALRLFPSVPFIERQFNEEIQIGGYTIPANCPIGIFIYGMHRREEIYPDPYAFKPSRFLNEAYHNRHPFSYIPFSAGPRNCIGQRFAMFEDKVALSILLYHFSFSVDPTMERLIPSQELILKSKQGFPLIISRRR